MSQNSNETSISLYFSLFNEIGIIDQLSTAALDKLMPTGLMHTHFGVLNHLIRLGDGRTPLEISTSFQVAKTTMTHTLAGLEKHKMVAIKPNPNDGRSKQVWLTEHGKTLRLQIIAKAGPALTQSLAGLKHSQIETLVNSLAQIRKVMDENR